MEHAFYVDREEPIPEIVGQRVEIIERESRRNPRVVHENVYPAEIGLNGVRHLSYGRIIANVCLVGMRLPACVLD